MSSQLCYGQCSSFDHNKGYGWITPNDNSADIFVHFSNINSNSSFRSLSPGQMVTYIPITTNNGKRKAVNVYVITSSNQNNNQNTLILNNNQNINSNNNNYNNNYNNNNYNNNNYNNNNSNQYNSYSTKPIQSYKNVNTNNNTTSQNNTNNLNVLSTNINTNPPPTQRQTNNTSNDTNNESKDSKDCNIETRYKWQWKGDFGTWKDFTEDVNLKILGSNNGSINYRIGQFSYTFIINSYNEYKATQINISTNTERECRKMEKKFAVYKGLTLKKMLESSWDNKYPSWWFDKDTKLHDAKLVEWPLDNEICVEIIDKFDASSNQFCVPYNIETIYSVQNKYLWKHYQFQRELHSEALGKNKLNERYLFHGTEYSATQKITVQGFLRDHGKIMAYGKGTYFAKNASMSIDYSPSDDDDYQWMFLCAVILGESICGRRSYNVPPTKPNSSVHYESMVDDETFPKIFVISKDYQAYPLFLIKFKQENNGLNGLNIGMSLFGIHSHLYGNNGLNNKNKKTVKKKKIKTSKSLIPIKMKSVQKTNQIISSNTSSPITQSLKPIPPINVTLKPLFQPLFNTKPVVTPIQRTNPISNQIMQLQNQILQTIKSNNAIITSNNTPYTYVPPIRPQPQPIATMSSRYIGNPLPQSQQLPMPHIPTQSHTSMPCTMNNNHNNNNNNNNNNNININVNRNNFTMNNTQNMSMQSINNNNAFTPLGNNNTGSMYNGYNNVNTQPMNNNNNNNNNNQSMNKMNSLPISSGPQCLPKWAKLTAPIAMVDTMPNSSISNTNTNILSNGPDLSPINEGSLYVGAPSPRSLTPYPFYLNSQPIAGSPMPPLNLLQINDVNS